MPHARLSAVVSCAQRAVAADADRSDGRLLGDFLTSRDEAAFAELVARFGPMVFAVCRRLTGHHQDAEDAFQAAFVVLARKAGSIWPREAIGNWLYGVAVRVAREARVVSAKRHAREVPRARLPETATLDWRPDDIGAVLDEELAELPDKFRMLLVLCDLRGEAQTEVAARLGLPVGTVYSRLAEARKRLAHRLGARGVALSAGGLTVSLAQSASAAVSTSLSAKAIAAAMSSDSLQAAVAALSHGVLRSMFLDRLRIAALLVASALGLAGGIAVATQPAADIFAPPQAAPLMFVTNSQQLPTKAAAQPLPRSPNRILIRRDGTRGERSFCLLDPDGKNEKEISEKASKFSVVGAKLAPDGKSFAAQVYGNQKPGEDPDKPYLYVRGLDEKEPGTYLGVAADCYVWSRDGTELACTEFEDEDTEKIPCEATHFIVNVKTKEKTALKLPNDHLILDWSADGKFFLTRQRTEKPKPIARLYLMSRDGSERKALTGANQRAIYGRLAPEGGRVLCAVAPVAPEKADRAIPYELAVHDLAFDKVMKVKDVPLNGQVLEFCWSPDGKQIAYLWRTIAEGDPTSDEVRAKETESHLVICDPDGSNPKTILSEKGTGIGMALSELDWR
jgi:RNA polymerase sigma factor (sigma-70 family)